MNLFRGSLRNSIIKRGCFNILPITYKSKSTRIKQPPSLELSGFVSPGHRFEFRIINTHFPSWRNPLHWIIYGFCCSNFAPAINMPRKSSSWWFFTNPFEKYGGQIGSKSSPNRSKNKKYLRCHQLGGCFIGIPTIGYNKPYNQGHLVT